MRQIYFRNLLVLGAFLFSSILRTYAIDAYWFNVPKIENINIGSHHISSSSKLYLSGNTEDLHSDMLYIKALNNKNHTIFERKFDLHHLASSDTLLFFNTHNRFRMELDVPFVTELPDKIIIYQHNTADTVFCQYNRLHIKIKDTTKHKKTGIAIYPDNFSNHMLYYDVPIDEIDIMLPQRAYFALLALSDSWGVSSLESWFWNLNLTHDRNINFTICNGEVYNLSVWANKGGGNSIFIYFRPMTIEDTTSTLISINDKLMRCFNPQLDIKFNNINLFFNDTLMPIYSLQSLYETGGIADYAIKAYIIQAPLPKMSNTTIKISFSALINQKNIYGEAQINF